MNTGQPLIGRMLPLIAFLLAACGTTEAPALPSQPPAAPLPSQPPSAPADWVTLTTEDGDIRLLVPPDIALVLAAPGLIQAQARFRDGVIPFEVTALGPGQLSPDTPVPGQSAFEYLQDLGQLPGAGEGVTFADTVERELMLPAGRAFEIRTSVQPGTAEEGHVVVYLIETEAGFALLRFVGTAADMEERIADMELMSQLVEFGSVLGP